MTDPVPPSALPAPSRVPGWIKAVLAASVALNLGIAGLALGAWLGDRPHGGRMPRDLSFGPFGEALSRDDRRALRLAFETRMPGMKPDREAARAEIDTLLAALRAEPYDAAALTAALQAIEDRLSGRIELGRSLLEEHILAMTEAERAAFAARLQEVLRHGSGS
jgi:uncharacterized membrane protein